MLYIDTDIESIMIGHSPAILYQARESEICNIKSCCDIT